MFECVYLLGSILIPLCFAFLSDEAAGTSEDELNCEKVEAFQGHESSGTRLGDQELKEMLLRKYSGYLTSLRKEFLKKRKKGKLPKDARMALMDWWNVHYRWPYPTVIAINIIEYTNLAYVVYC